MGERAVNIALIRTQTCGADANSSDRRSGVHHVMNSSSAEA